MFGCSLIYLGSRAREVPAPSGALATGSAAAQAFSLPLDGDFAAGEYTVPHHLQSRKGDRASYLENEVWSLR